ncbi:MAG TPA: hypothetical protein DD990_17295 [Cyanobacteria bacterium UBA11368]|nr:hypothetical protein [Cyanobacteria bacterium UBA11368]
MHRHLNAGAGLFQLSVAARGYIMSGCIGSVNKGRVYLFFALLAKISRKTRPYILPITYY